MAVRESIVSMIAFGLGAGIGVYYAKRSIKDVIIKTPVLLNYMLTLMFTLYVLIILYTNAEDIFKPIGGEGKNTLTISELVGLLTSAPHNLKLISLGTFLLLTAIVYLIIKLPFMRWKTVKTPIFEGTLEGRAEHIVSASKEEIIDIRNKELLRLAGLRTMIAPSIHNIIKEKIIGDYEIDTSDIIVYTDLIASLLTDTYKKAIRSDAIPVNNGQINIRTHSLLVDDTINMALNIPSGAIKSQYNHSVLAKTLTILDFPQRFIIYFEIEGDEFDERDQLLLDILLHVFNMQIQLAVYDEEPLIADQTGS